MIDKRLIKGGAPEPLGPNTMKHLSKEIKMSESVQRNGAKTFVILLIAAFPFLLLAVFEKIQHILIGGLGGF